MTPEWISYKNQNKEMSPLSEKVGLTILVIFLWTAGAFAVISGTKQVNRPPEVVELQVLTDVHKVTVVLAGIDPEGDSIRYIVDWGDGKRATLGCYGSGDTVRLTHTNPISGQSRLNAVATFRASARSPFDDSVAVTLPPGTLKWRHRIGGGLSSLTIGTDGSVCVYSDSNYLYLFNPAGAMIWCHKVNGNLGYGPVYTLSPEGIIYIGQDEYLCALNPDGSERWRHRAMDTVLCLGLSPDGSIVFMSWQELSSISPNGHIRWTTATWQIKEEEERDYFLLGPDGAVYHTMHALSAPVVAIGPEGKVMWEASLPENDGLSFVGPDGTLYLEGINGITAISSDVVKQRFTETGSFSISDIPAKWNREDMFHLGFRESIIFVGHPRWPETGDSLVLFSLKVEDGSQKWRFNCGVVFEQAGIFGHSHIFALSNGTIYFYDSRLVDSSLYAISDAGELLWKYRLPSQVKTWAIGPDRTVYLGSCDHFIYAIDSAGTLKWHYQTGGVVSSIGVGSDGTVYAGDDAGFLYAFQGSSSAP